MGVQIDLRPRLKVLSRLRVLHHVVHELMRGFGVQEDKMDVIQKGILDKQVLNEITIAYLNAEGKMVGRVTLKIDWSTHRVLAQSNSGKNFEIDQGRSISEQLSQLYPILIDHTKEIRKAFKVTKIETRYSYTPDVWSDSTKLKEVREYLGLSRAERIEWVSKGERSGSDELKGDIELEVVASQLAELKISIEHIKPMR